VTPFTAVLLDQHPLWLEAVVHVVENTGVKVVGQANTPKRALELVERHQPVAFVTEIRMPPGEMDGIACLREAIERVPTLVPIVLSAYDDPRHIEEALQAGAAAYVIKTVHPNALASTIRHVLEHAVPTAARAVPSRVRNQAADPDFPVLTPRQREILQLVEEGFSNAQIAKMLWVTEQTVKFHLANVYRLLGVASRTQAVRFAQVRGLLPPTPAQATLIRYRDPELELGAVRT
jgi:two-component system response regulator DevR